MTTPVLPDDVWQQLDHDAGRMPRSLARRLLIAGLAVGVLVIAAVGGWRSGALMPNFSESHSGGSSWEISPPNRTFAITFWIRNNGLVDADIDSVGRSAPGLQLTRGVTEKRVAAGQSVEIRLEYQITDCDAVAAGRWPIPIRVKRFFGTQTAYVRAPEMIGPSAPDSYSYTGDVNPYAVEWQWLLAQQACGRIHP
jgi:hypothetical protein